IADGENFIITGSNTSPSYVSSGFVPLQFGIGGNIDLTNGGGRFVLEWNLDSSFVGGDVPAFSIEVDYNEVVGQEYFTPIIETFILESGQLNPKLNLGSDICRIGMFVDSGMTFSGAPFAQPLV